jgi:hypothetical protein
MKIISFKIKSLINTEFFGFLKQAVALFVKYDPAKLKIKNKSDALAAKFASLAAALEKERANHLTKILNELDRKRDVLIWGFIKFLDAMTDYPDAAIAANAVKLLAFVESFGKNIAQQTQLSETTILTAIVDGFTNNIERKTALAGMNGTLWITALGEVNNEFAKQYSNRVSDVASNNTIESFSDARKEATVLYAETTDLLISRYNSDKADNLDVSAYEACIGDLNELIGKANLLATTPKSPTASTKEEGK